MPLTEWKNGVLWLTWPIGTNLGSPLLVGLDSSGFWPLALRDAWEHPLFCGPIHYFGTIEGPRLDSYPGIVFLILALGKNLASTYCDKHLWLKLSSFQV